MVAHITELADTRTVTTSGETGTVLTERDRVFLGPHDTAQFLAIIESDPRTDGRYPSSIAFLKGLLLGRYNPDAPARAQHGTLDPDAWNTAVTWMVQWCEEHPSNPWHILTDRLLSDLHTWAATDPRATDATRTRILLAITGT